MKRGSPQLRIYMLSGLLGLMAVLFFSRLMQMQLVDGESYTAQLTRGSTEDQVLTAARGEILDRYGRPLAANTIAFDLQLSRAQLPRGQENKIILQVTNLLKGQDEQWSDSLPISENPPYSYTEGGAFTPAALRGLLGLGDYASAADAMYWLVERYELSGYSPAEQRRIAGVRCDMERQGFNLRQPFTLATGISIETVSLIKQLSLDLPGVRVEETARRIYENGAIAPHLVGRVGPLFQNEYEQLRDQGYRLSDQIGKEGIEKAFESELRGENGVRRTYLTVSGRAEGVEDVQPPVPGNTVVLTLDSRLQERVTQALKDQIAYLNATYEAGRGKEADAGAVAVINVKTGEILALVNYPSYDLATFNQDYAALTAPGSGNPLFNRVLTGLYAPGSCFKPVVGLAGLNEGVITPATTVFCGQVYTLASDPNHAFTCLSAHGSFTLRQAIRESCNIFFYDTGYKLGIDKINDYAKRLGLGVPTGIDLPEVAGSQSKDNPSRPGDTLQAAIGQMGNAYSPLQLANYAATIANRGKRMELSIISRISSYNFERVLYEHKPAVASYAGIEDRHFDALIAGMIDASHIGTARGVFANYPITVASKTGTPETTGLLNSVFIAYAPAEEPEIAVAVIIEKGYHGYTGAPVAKAVFDYHFFGESDTYPAEGIDGAIS